MDASDPLKVAHIASWGSRLLVSYKPFLSEFAGYLSITKTVYVKKGYSGWWTRGTQDTSFTILGQTTKRPRSIRWIGTVNVLKPLRKRYTAFVSS